MNDYDNNQHDEQETEQLADLDDLEYWLKYLQQLPPADCISCPYAKIMEREIKGPDITYEPGDILCVLFRIGAQQISRCFPDVCHIHNLNRSSSGVIRANCYKLGQPVTLNSSPKKSTR